MKTAAPLQMPGQKQSDPGKRNIADICSFEELRKTVDERLPCSWLSEVNRKNDFKKIQTAWNSQASSSHRRRKSRALSLFLDMVSFE